MREMILSFFLLTLSLLLRQLVQASCTGRRLGDCGGGTGGSPSVAGNRGRSCRALSAADAIRGGTGMSFSLCCGVEV